MPPRRTDGAHPTEDPWADRTQTPQPSGGPPSSRRASSRRWTRGRSRRRATRRRCALRSAARSPRPARTPSRSSSGSPATPTPASSRWPARGTSGSSSAATTRPPSPRTGSRRRGTRTSACTRRTRATIVEETAGGWMLDLLGLPPGASHGFDTGGTMANFTGIAAGRHALLERAGWDVERQGLYGAPRARRGHRRRGPRDDLGWRSSTSGSGASASTSCRPTSRAACGSTGCARRWPRARARPRLRPGGQREHRRRSTRSRRSPTSSGPATTRGSTSTERSACGPPRRRGSPGLVAGVERADSWATDAHKWLNVPYDCGFVATADPSAHRAAMSIAAAYLVQDTGRARRVDWTPEFSRRARGFAVYAVLRSLGRDGVREMIERCCDVAARMAERLRDEPGVDGAQRGRPRPGARPVRPGRARATRTPTRGHAPSSRPSSATGRAGSRARRGTGSARCGSPS